uniref:Glucokinase regulatory protein n=1 Tax=Xenopus laevis TaxID=8355 RepID=GCKR_XENLA|nr:RecName: Full=Glucokinase regulatory protein; Short=GKRP; Short=Glucokinase regulator [Xenopus laevis]CAA56863.1 glucokinase regulator [Xenopus laevis]
MRGTRKYQHVIETPDPGKWELAGYEESLPISEKSNPMTRELDKADPSQLVQLLRDCDAEIFQEEDENLIHYHRLYSESVLKTMGDVAKRVQEVLKNPDDSLVVLSGCGTSGRLALLLANSFNGLLKGLHKTPCYCYIMSGGDRSIVTSQESSEDNPQLGAQELEKVCEGKKNVLFIGISCGLSAPFIAGQLDFCMRHLDVYLPVLVGFNPVSMARNERIEGWHSSFRQVAERLQTLHDSQKGFILNPAVGPEGVSGSSRMKGGSATKILLETLLLVAHKAESNVPVTEKCLLEILRTYERAHKVTYSQSKKIAALMKQTATSLQKKGHLYILGWGTLGLVGIMDAVECVPTYQADWRDVRGFITGGYHSIENKEGDLSSLGPQFSISHEDFVKNVLPSVSETDTVLLIFTLDDDLNQIEKLVALVKEKTSNIQVICHATAGQYLPNSLKKTIPSIIGLTWPILFLEYEGAFIQKFQRELSTKWILDTVTSGAYTLRGKIFRNFMVDFKINNSKLFHRATSVLQRLTGQSHQRCTEVLLQSIYGEQTLSEQIRNTTIAGHVEAAASQDKVLPVAIVSLLRSCTIQDSRSRINSSLSIRSAIESSMNVPGRKRGAEDSESR